MLVSSGQWVFQNAVAVDLGQAGGAMKIIWRVLDPNSKAVAAFPYPKKDDADAKAAALSKRHDKEYRVRPVKVPLNTEV